MTRNLVFVSHCDFQGNSAMHLFSIANVLTDLGHSCAVCVPGRPKTVLDHGQPRFQVLDYDEAVLHGVSFANRRGPDLIHAWTPRELVRKTTMALACRYNIPYFVHLEDNDMIVLLDELPGWSREDLEGLPARALDAIVSNHRAHPHRSRRLLAGAAGITALIDRLLELKPPDVPGMVFFPGYDAGFARIEGRDEGLRKTLGIAPDELLLVYSGSVHNSNSREVRSLLLAVALVNRRGFGVKLVKTGWNLHVLPELSYPEIARHIIDRGFVARSEIPALIAAADVLVQPGRSNEFNDFRFPSKLPEFLASGRPVILPRSNVGLLLKDGEEALLLSKGNCAQIADALQRLAIDPRLRAKIGRGGRAFALRNLDWAKNVTALPSFYDYCLTEARQPGHPSAAEEPSAPKLIAFYVPQVHPIPENDSSSANGFSEWVETVAARPNFEGHVQPRLPADLGFYDLRLPETMDAQVALARQFGVFGFCFHYYWFGERRLLQYPLDQFLARGQPDFPFCICWANEHGTNCSDGQKEEVLIKQEYGEDSSLKFIRDVIPILKDPRYIKVGIAPVLMVYRVTLLPDPRATAEIWRTACRKAGISSVHLVAAQSFGVTDPRLFGFDAAAEIPPDTRRFLIDIRTFGGVNPTFEGTLEDYHKVVNDQLAKPFPDYTLYRGVMPSWDDTPRRKQRAHIFVHCTPADYQTWLRGATAQALALAEAQEPLIFVNAWNGWAEGAILEPDMHNGFAFLEATLAGLSEGLADQLRARGISLDQAAVAKLLMPDDDDVARFEPIQSRRQHKSDMWFTDEQLADVAAKYRNSFKTAPLSYATVRDFCDSFEHLRPIATANGDPNTQRPWVLKAILAIVPPGSRVLEIGAGEPFIADILDRLGYEVWVVNPYDSTRNGSLEYERFRDECPGVHFVRSHFGEHVLSAPPGGFDCIYSISVLDRLPHKVVEGVFAGMRKYLQPNGWSIHAIDHLHKGNGAEVQYEKLKFLALCSGIDEIELAQLLERMDADSDTYYLCTERVNRWPGSLSCDETPTNACVRIQMVCSAFDLRVPT